MSSSSRLIAAAAVGVLVLVLLCLPAGVSAQPAPRQITVASLASGSIAGTVFDEVGTPIPGATVSALGATTSFAVTDRGGRFELRTLPPGPYLIRAHISGFVGSRGQLVDVRPSARSSSSISLRHATVTSAPTAAAAPVLAAGIGETPSADAPATSDVVPASKPVDADSTPDDDHSEVAWRLRHVRRGILKDVALPDSLLTDLEPDGRAFGTAGAGMRTFGSGSLSTSLLTGIPISGQFNLLTTGSFDSPQQLFTADSFSRGIAYVSLASPVGDHGDWSMQGALTQGDLSSWFVAGAYATRAPARNRFDLGLSYSTQRYDGGNPAALREVTDGSRNVGAVYGFDTFSVVPGVTVTYGARFSRYDYLESSGLISPRAELTLTPAEHLRLTALASSRALAPGAEEFLPPVDTGLWLPPQRTFSSLTPARSLTPERTDHFAVEAERDFGASTVSVRGFHQHVDNQLVTLFGVEVPSDGNTEIGHYFVGNNGNVDANGWSAALRTTIAGRIHGSMEYSQSVAQWLPKDDAALLLVLAPGLSRPTRDRVQGLATTIETNVPETATRVVIVYRVTSALAASNSERQAYDARFDVQVRQSLPFMDFSTARWEMLLAVRNTFREATAESSVYDELLVSRPPKRIVGGLTLRF